MKKITLGRTKIEVSELCFGALPIGPLQKNLDVQSTAEVIAHGLNNGITFIDTAMMYKTYEPIKLAMEMTKIRPVISNKSHVTTYEDMEASINDALEKLGVDYIDIFLLHAARVQPSVFEDRSGAYRALLDYREKGVLKSIGISTHAVDVVKMSALNKEIDIIFPIINKLGLGILRGSLEEMRTAIELCFAENKGVYLMKALGGGNLIGDYLSAMDYCREFANGRASVVLGMINKDEVDMNLKYFNNESIKEELLTLKAPKKNVQVFKAICKGCGLCVENCHSEAISLLDGKAFVHDEICLKCGYCSGSCPEFAIRVI